MTKFLGDPVTIPAATSSVHAVQRGYVDAADTALGSRVTTLESTSGSGKLTPVAVTADYTAHVGDLVVAVIQNDNQTLTVTLPSSPNAGDRVGIKLAASTSASYNTFTNSYVAVAGAVIDSGSGQAYLLASAGEMITLQYFGSSAWYAVNEFGKLRWRGDYIDSTAGNPAGKYWHNDVVRSSGNLYLFQGNNSANRPITDTVAWVPLITSSTTSISVGTTTTGAPGTSASVTNSGTSTAPILNFTIPQGAAGAAGSAGSAGSAGAAATVAVGTTTTGNAGTNAAVTNSGSTSAAVLNFTVPKGADGSPGSTGTAGAAATVAVGTTTTGAAGSNAAVSNSGTSAAAVLNFTVPQGAAGAAGTPGSTGATGPGVATGGTTGQVLAKNSSTNYDTGWITPASGGGLTPTVLSAAGTATAGQLILANAASAGFTVTLPTAPATGAQVGVKKTDSSTNLVTVVGPNPTTIDGDPSAVLLNQNSAGTFVFDGTNWRVASTAVLAFAGSSGTTDALFAPLYTSGYWYDQRSGTQAVQTVAGSLVSPAPTVSTIYYLPGYFTKSVSISAVATWLINAQSTTAAAIRMGVYSPIAATGLPGALISDFGLASLNNASVGPLTVTPGSSVTLPKGFVWWALSFNSTSVGASNLNGHAYSAGSPPSPVQGWSNANFTSANVTTSNPIGCAYMATATGDAAAAALASTAPTSLTLNYGTASTTVPNVYFKIT